MIEKDKVVSFHYRLTDSEGKLLEESHGGDALAYLHGHNNMLTGLEQALEGKKAGESFSITLPPEQAYGLRQENAVQRVPIKHVVKASRRSKYQPGDVVQINTSQGHRDVIVVKAGLKNIDVDTNHPFAGKTLTFAVDIVAVRDATEDEIAHGHAHGVGGHHH